MSVEIVGPFNDYALVIEGWSVPLIRAVELDGGKVHLTLDHRIGLTVDTKDFEPVAKFVADVIGTCFGYGAHPRSQELADAGIADPFEDQRAAFARVPHPSLAPHRMHEITSVSAEDNGDDI